ncbi:YadA-like family protein [Campylobacter hominis]
MNKAYRHVYKDGIGWVAIAENASSVSSSKGSGTVVEKSGVEVLKNFFDLRNSVVLNNGFLLKGLFAATLFCGVFVGDLRAETSQNIQDKAVSTGGTAVYVDDGGKRFIQNKQGGYIDTEGKGLIKIRDQWYRVDNYDEKGVITLSDGKKYVIPTGTLNAILYDKNYNPYMVAGSGTSREKTPVFFDIEMTLSTKNSNKIVKYDENDKKWYVYNNDGEKLYLARKKEGGQYYGLHKYSELKKNSDGVPIQDKDGYYVLSSSASVSADEVRKGNTFEDLQGNFEKLNGTPDFNKNTPTRLGLVGLDGINTMPETYSTADETNGKIPADRKVGDNKNGKIRLGNVAKAELDDEAVNLGQLNETLKNLNTGTGKVPYVHINSSIIGSGSNHDNDGAKGENAIAIGPNAKSGDNSVAIGLNAKTGEGVIDKASYDKIKKEIESVKNKYKRAEQLGNQEKMAEFGKRRDELEELLKTYDKRYEHNGKLITEADFDKLSAADKKKATIKYISSTMYENSVAIGHDAQALANDAVAIGNGAKVIVDGSKVIVAGGGVAIGQDSVSNAREDKDLKGYRPKAFSIDETSNAFKNNQSAWVATNQPFAVGDDRGKEKITRQITGVAAGTKDTDAVNVAQLKQTGFYVEGDIGAKSRIQNEDEYDNGTLNIKTDDNWKNDRSNIVYTGKNLETKIIPSNPATDPATKRPYATKIKIGMTDTPRFKSITIANDDAVNNKDDNSPIELKKFDNNTNNNTIGFAGKGDSAIKLTNLAEGTIGEGSKDAITGGQLQKIIKGGLKFTANSGEHTAELGSTVSVKGAGTDWAKFDNGENIMTNIDGNNIVVGLSKDLKNITSIENGGKTYTFGDATLGDTSVITNKDLETKGYVTADTQKTTSVSTEADSGIKVVSEATGKNTDYKLSLDKDKVKEIAGTTSLTADLKGKANVAADNLSNDNVTSWQNKLGINDKADKTEITKLTTNINNKADKTELTNLANKDLSNITNNGKTEIKKLAKGSVEVKAADGQDIVKVENTTPNTDKDTYTVSVNADKLAKNNTFITSLGDNFAKKDASNIADNKADWETALGLKEYVKSVDSTDNFIEVNSNDKQNPKLSLNTTNLAGDKTFVENIAGNQNFTTKLGDTFVTKTNLAGDLAGYTKLDGSNLATIAKNTWRTALGVSDGDIKKVAQESVNVKAETGSKITVADKGIVDGKQTFEVGVDLTGLNGTAYTFAAGENLTVEDKSGKVKYSLNKDLKNITSIENGGKTYTFGDATLGDTSVITNKDLETKGYVTADTQKTTSVSTEADSGIKVVSEATGKNTDYKLSLDKDKVKEIAGTTSLTADLKGKANVAADNLSNDNVTSWQNKLGINDKADKTEITKLTTKIDSGNFISLSVSANGGSAKDEIKANENIDFTAKDGIKVAYDKNVNKFTFSADINSIAGNIADNDAFSTKYAMLNGNNLKPANGFDQNAWRGALGLKNSDIANIFEGKGGISIKQNGNKYTIAYKGTGGGTGTGGIDEDKVNEIIKKYIGGDNIGSSKGSTDNIVTHNVSKQETTNNKNIIAAINKINKEGIGFVHVNGGDLALDASGKSKNDSSAEGKNAIAIGPKSRAVGNNSISIGPNSKANGENSIAIGLGNEVTGKNSGAFGDPTYINEDNSYAIGNKNKIDSKDTFILGNKVTVGAGMQGAVVLGNNSNADKATQESSATVDGSIITYDGFAGQANGEGMILSVGAKGAERQIKNVAAGKISKDSTDAVNGSQLYATNKIIGNVASSVANVIGGGNAKVNNNGEISASNIGGTGKKTINDAIAYINNNNKSGNQYIAINTPKGSVLPNVSEDSNSIAIGAGSNDGGRKNVVSVGNAKTGLNRTITNVAPGKYGTDAVNMNQLYGVAGGLSKQINDVKKKSSAGIAGAVALGMLPQSNIPGDALVSIGTGYHDSESAVALGISKTSDNARWIFKGGVSYDSQDEVTAGASVGFHF